MSHPACSDGARAWSQAPPGDSAHPRSDAHRQEAPELEDRQEIMHTAWSQRHRPESWRPLELMSSLLVTGIHPSSRLAECQRITALGPDQNALLDHDHIREAGLLQQLGNLVRRGVR